MTTLKFNRYETLSAIENMFLSNIIDVVRNVEVPSASKLRNMLHGAQDGHLYSFEATISTFKSEVRESVSDEKIQAYRVAADIELFERELRNRLTK
tara:strand:+ start:694 stop:981 length:288 start_codon:yes stop_codon:yes gene_type:complete